MGFVEKDRDALTGNSLLIGDLVLSWDEEEPLSLDVETKEEPDIGLPEQEKPSKVEEEPGK